MADVDISHPLLLTHVPMPLQEFYVQLSGFITKGCGLSVRYVSGRQKIAEELSSVLINAITDALENNRSLAFHRKKMTTAFGYYNYNNLLTSDGTQQIKFRNPKEHDETLQLHDCVVDILNDENGILKIVGIDTTKADGTTVFIPLWGMAFCTSSIDRHADRELKLCFCDPRISGPAEIELNTLLLIHTLIEAAWLCPDMSSPPTHDDKKRIISAMVDTHLVYWPVQTIEILERMKCFEQHFEGTKLRSHNSVGCSCVKLHEYEKSFIISKASVLKAALWPGVDKHEKGNMFLLAEPFLSDGPSEALKYFIKFILDDFGKEI